MGRNKHIGILGVAVIGLLTLGACGSKQTTSPGIEPAHALTQQVWGKDYVQCANVPRTPC